MGNGVMGNGMQDRAYTEKGNVMSAVGTTAARAALLLALALGAGPASAQDLPDGLNAEDVAQFRAAIVDAGCEIRTEAQAQLVEQATGFSEEKLSALAKYLIGAGTLTVSAEFAGFAMLADECGGENEDD